MNALERARAVTDFVHVGQMHLYEIFDGRGLD
jgi:hypothetical protein